VDESAPGSVNLWSGRLRSGFARERGRPGHCSLRPLVAVEPDDVRVLFEVLFDIRKDTRRVLWILEGDDDEEEEEDA
jgi:hypothetical protein